MSHYKSVRVNVLIRDNDMKEFCLYEEYLEHFRISDFEWTENKNSNFEGYNKRTHEKLFTWQPHGSQFTIHSKVPEDSIKFRVKKPSLLTKELALQNIEFNSSWIEML